MIVNVFLVAVLPGVLVDNGSDPLLLGSISVTPWEWEQVIRCGDTLIGYDLLDGHVQDAGFEWPF